MPEIAKLWATIGADTSDLESGLKRSDSAVTGFAKSAGLAIAAAGAGIVAAGGFAINAAAGFEQTMSGVKAVSGATATEMKGLSGLALQLGKDTSFSASAAAAGIEELVKGGLNISDIMGGAAKSTLDLAAAGGVSLPEAATIAANALAQFGLKGKDMAHVADLIAGAANASALDVGQFKFSLQAAGAVASTVGFNFDDLSVAIAEMGKAGIVGSDAGTSLKTMFMSLQPSTKTATEAMRQLGIITANGKNQFFDATGKVKSMAEVAGILQTATAKLTQQQKLQTLQTIFGSDAIRAAAVFAKEGAGGFNEMAGAMGKVTAASVGAERLNNLSGDVEQLKGSIETLAIEFGTAFLPVLRDATQWITSMVNGMIPWIERVGPLAVATIQQLGAAFGDLFRTGDIGVFADDLRESFGLDVGPLVTAVTAIETAVGNIATGFKTGGLAGAFGAWLGEAGKFGGFLLSKLGEWGQALVDWIAPKIPPMLVEAGKLADSLWTWITTTALPTIVTKLGEWGTAFTSWIGPKIEPMLTEAGKLAGRLWTWITDTAAPAILTKLGAWGTAFVDWISPNIGPMLTEAGKLATRLWTWITEDAGPTLFAKLGEWGKQFADWVGPMIPPLLVELGKLGTALWTWITDTAAPAILTKLGSWKDQFVAWIGPATDDFLKAWPGNLTRFLNWIEFTAAPAISTTLSSWAKTFVAWIGGADGTGEGTAAGGLFKTIGNIATVIWTFITKTAEVLGPRLASWAGKFLAWVGTDVVPFLAVELGKMLIEIGRWIVTDGIPWAAKAFVEMGKAIVGGIVSGILALPNALADAIKQLTTFTPRVVVSPGVAVAAPSGGITTVSGPRPRYGETVAQGPNASGQYAYTSDGGRSVEWRDQGGPGVAGSPYAIGVPEVFVPDRPGQFYPLGGAGGDRNNQPIQVQIELDGSVLARVLTKHQERLGKRGAGSPFVDRHL